MNPVAPGAKQSLSGLPNQLLALLCKEIGVKDALSSLVANSQLHLAWQASVENVSIKYSNIISDDLITIQKLVNLENLSFHGRVNERLPPARVAAALVGPALTRLTRLAFQDVRGAFDVLAVLAGSSDLATRLRALSISDASHTLSTHDLLPLANLKAISSVELFSKTLESAPDHLSTISSQLGHLVHLDLGFEDGRRIQPSQLAALPGGITSLERLSLRSDEFGDKAHEQEQLVNAVSALTNLRELSSNLALGSAAAQQRALAKLKKLQQLNIVYADTTGAEFELLAELPELESLSVGNHMVRDPFTHPGLTSLAAARLDAGEQWRGKTAEECGIQELALSWSCLGHYLHDELLRNMPLLPALHTFRAGVDPEDGRFLQLAALVHRQAGTLCSISLYLQRPFQEALPRELPACTSLSLMYKTVSVATLQLLAMCSMPLLRELVLELQFLDSSLTAGLDVDADLAWLRRLPGLRKLVLRMDSTVAAPLKAVVEDMLQGRGVVVETHEC